VLCFKVVTHYPTIGLRYLQTKCVNNLQPAPCLFERFEKVLITRNIPLLTQVVFDKVVPRVVTTADTVLIPVVLNWGGGRGERQDV